MWIKEFNIFQAFTIQIWLHLLHYQNDKFIVLLIMGR